MPALIVKEPPQPQAQSVHNASLHIFARAAPRQHNPRNFFSAAHGPPSS
jgi:hypothetical protein